MTLNVHNHDAKCSGNGTLLTDIIKNKNLKPFNFTDKCIGKWTHINTKKLSERSILDYVIIEEQFYEQINDMLIDEDKQFCPFRLRKQKGKIITTPSDHNPIILTLNLKKSDIPKFEQGKSVWKYTKKVQTILQN